MTASILDSIKKLLGLASDYTAFDEDVIIAINAAFFTLMQLGVGPAEGFCISDRTAVWSDFISSSIGELEGVKEYVYLKTRLAFDPPTNSTVLQMMKEQVAEYEWRLNVQVDP